MVIKDDAHSSPSKCNNSCHLSPQSITLAIATCHQITLNVAPGVYKATKKYKWRQQLTCNTEVCLKPADRVLFFLTKIIRRSPSHSEKLMSGTGFLGSILTTEDSTCKHKVQR
ncbi:hypothetical protein E2C01_012129 [Portunus trituberculatus]|uniref:Uncharacterized protein n=1 Tax=Portunus trituberculatus TaxID=210409 RepID=A0A5B7DD44_PORTR|nr:hypothetical protein [Portunus trituberculatus]